MKIKKQNILINNAGAGFLISSTGVIYSTGAWGCSHQIYYSFSASASLLRIHNCVMAKKVSRSLTFSEKKLTKYFPDDYTAKDMEQVIESLLEKWMQEQSC